jgi:outer membrane protein assembly factor BamB
MSLALGDHVILSSPGGVLERFRTSGHNPERYDQDARELPNAPVTFRFDQPRFWMAMLGFGQLSALAFTDPLQHFGGFGTCAPQNATGYQVAALDFRHLLLFLESPISHSVTVFDLNTEETRRCTILPARVEGIPAVDSFLVYMATAQGDLQGFGDIVNHAATRSLWTVATGDSLGSPTVGPFGLVYVRTGTRLAVFDRHGTQQWQYDAGAPFETPVPLGYGLVLLTTENGTVHAVREGDPMWTVQLEGALTDPVVASDGRVFVGSDNGRLYTLTP